MKGGTNSAALGRQVKAASQLRFGILITLAASLVIGYRAGWPQPPFLFFAPPKAVRAVTTMPTITINGESRLLPEGATVAQVLDRLGYDRRRIAVEVNREVVPLVCHAERRLSENDAVEIVTLVGGGAGDPVPPAEAPLVVGSFQFRSRLITGTGKYASFELMQNCLAASGCEVTTVAVRRERLVDKQGRNILDFLDLNKYTILPNTAGCFSAEDAVRHARLARELLSNLGNAGARWVKPECLGDPKTLLPDPVDTLKATEQLVKEGFEVLVYTSDDPISWLVD